MRSDGKANSPFALLTTVVVIEDPCFLALTRTPSIGPSSAEETVPLSAAACAFVPEAVRPAENPANRPSKLTVVKNLLNIMSSLPADRPAESAFVNCQLEMRAQFRASPALPLGLAGRMRSRIQRHRAYHRSGGPDHGQQNRY